MLSASIASAQTQVQPQAQTSDEVPFITSPDNVTLEMLNAAGVKRGDHVIDLGSGDGRIVILAAKRFEATGLGVEIAAGVGVIGEFGLLKILLAVQAIAPTAPTPNKAIQL